MLKFTFKRMFSAAATVFVLITLTFFLLKMIPNGLFADPNISKEMRARLYELYGLDKPVWQQYLIYMKNLLRLDLGDSIAYPGRKITTMILDPATGNGLPMSMKLGIASLLFSVPTGIALGTVAGLNRGRFLDKLMIGISLVGVSVPSFVFATMSVTVFGNILGWLPTTGFSTPREMALPIFCLSLGTIATISRLMRTSLVELESADFIKTAKAKGLRRSKIVFRHQIRNALLPIVTVLGPITASLLTGTFVVEAIFNIKGLGGYYVESISNRDYGLVMGLTVIFGTFLVVCNLVVDIVYGLIDPRIRLKQ
ncbi:MAG: ABC transporter permease [Oscillospiraceae bacterium]|nr:ABC transporter permease [Oscillospiraceae bacterium]